MHTHEIITTLREVLETYKNRKNMSNDYGFKNKFDIGQKVKLSHMGKTYEAVVCGMAYIPRRRQCEYDVKLIINGNEYMQHGIRESKLKEL